MQDLRLKVQDFRISTPYVDFVIPSIISVLAATYYYP